MPKPLKISIWVVSGLAVGLALVAAAVVLFLDANAFKPQLEAAASRAMGMEVQIDGNIGVGLFPGVHLTLEGVQIHNRGIKVGSAPQAKLGIELLPLFQQQARVTTVSLRNAKLTIERDRNGVFSFENTEKPKGTPRTLDLEDLSAVHATVLYVDKQSGRELEASNCKLDASRLRLTGTSGTDLLKNLHITADMACARVSTKDFVASDVKLSAQGDNGIVHLKPVSMQIFGGQGSGQVDADFSGQVPHWKVHYSLTKFRIEEFLEPHKPKQTVKGLMDFSVKLSMHGKTQDALHQTAAGEASLRGQNLRLDGRDLDRELSRYASTQKFNLVDAGALFFAGPLGLAVTKGYDFANLFRGKEGSSTIRVLVSEWKVERGVAEAKDVAMATAENRLALKGDLDFVNKRYEHVTVAIVDARGCTLVRQKIRGPFDKPVVEKPNIIKTIAGPAVKLLSKTKGILTGRHCEMFYSGSVAPP